MCFPFHGPHLSIIPNHSVRKTSARPERVMTLQRTEHWLTEARSRARSRPSWTRDSGVSYIFMRSSCNYDLISLVILSNRLAMNQNKSKVIYVKCVHLLDIKYKEKIVEICSNMYKWVETWVYLWSIFMSVCVRVCAQWMQLLIREPIYTHTHTHTQRERERERTGSFTAFKSTGMQIYLSCK